MTACHLHDIQQSIFLNRDENAFKELYDHFYAPLYSFAKALTGSGVLAQEVTQDVFVKIWQHKDKLDEVKNLKTYLFVIARNVSLNYRKDKQQFFRTEDVSDMVLRFSDKDKTPEQQLLSKEILHHINNAVEALPPRCKLIFKLVKENGLKYSEVGEILSLSVNTIENQMSTALKRLSQSVDRQLIENSI
jgi:RNA polymerase sigma-70 factor (family 1)